MDKKIKDIKKPEFMKAAVTSRSHNAALELLIALAVFLIGDLAVSFLQMPAMLLHMLSSGEYIRMIQSNRFDMQTIMNLVLNLPDWIMIVNLISEAGLIVIFILYCRLFEKRRAHTMGFRKKGFVTEYLKGILMGILAFAAVYLICLLSGSIEFHAAVAEGFSFLYLIGFLMGYIIQGMAEEVICRGYLLVSLSKRYSVVTSIIISSLFFMMLHRMNFGMSFLSYVNLFLFGVLMSLLMIRYENIWLIGAFHGIWNFVEGNIFGIQVSGLQKQVSLFTSIPTEDRSLIHGGSFGAEGGFATTLVFLCIIALLLWRMKKKGYFVEEEPVLNPYDIAFYNSRMQNRVAPYEQVQNPSVQNQPKPEVRVPSPETMENPSVHPSGNMQTKFDQSYFREEEDNMQE